MTPSKYLRINQIVWNRDKTNDPLLPISATSFWDGVREGKYPQPIKLGKTTLWPADEIYAFLDGLKDQRAA